MRGIFLAGARQHPQLLGPNLRSVPQSGCYSLGRGITTDVFDKTTRRRSPSSQRSAQHRPQDSACGSVAGTTLDLHRFTSGSMSLPEFSGVLSTTAPLRVSRPNAALQPSCRTLPSDRGLNATRSNAVGYIRLATCRRCPLCIQPAGHVRKVPTWRWCIRCKMQQAEREGAIQPGHIFVVNLIPLVAHPMIVREIPRHVEGGANDAHLCKWKTVATGQVIPAGGPFNNR